MVHKRLPDGVPPWKDKEEIALLSPKANRPPEYLGHEHVTFAWLRVRPARLESSAMSATFLDAVSAGCVIDGRFSLIEQLGETGSTSAWLTELDDRRAQKAAIKLFPYAAVNPDATFARWDVARTLSHPHLMPLFHAGRCEIDGEDLLYVVTEYAEETLSQVLPERPLSPDEVREMIGPVLSALSYLHKLGFTHGHLRPANVMAVNGQLKLSPDFGWCSRSRSIYDPPEAATGDTGPASDVWSLGILLIEALTQHPPRWQKSQIADPEIPAAIPEPFFTICRECLRVDPERRCTLSAIKAYLGPPEAAPAVESAAPILDAAPKRSYRFQATVFAGVILFLLFLIAAFTVGWNLTPSSPWPPFQSQAKGSVAH